MGLIAILLISIYSIFPILSSPHNLITDKYDGLFITWTQNQVIQKIPNNLGQIFEGNILYPQTKIKAFSDMFVPSSIISLVPVTLSNQPILAFSTTLLAGQILTLSVLYIFFLKLTKNKSAALIATTALGLSQIRLHYSVHLQMWAMQWWLISLFFLWSYLHNKKPWHIYAAAIFAGIQIWESPFPIFLLIFSSAPLLFLYKENIRKNIKHIIVASLLAILIMAPVAATYFKVSKEQNYTRSIRDAAHHSMQVEDLGTKFLSPGLYVLSGFSLWQLYKNKKRKSKEEKWLMALVIIGALMALGPVVKSSGETVKIFGKFPIPLPYSIAYYIVPGFGGLRTPSRWIWLAAFGASGLIASWLSKYNFPKNKTILALALFIAIIGGTRIKEVKSVPTPSEYPEVYNWLENQNVNTIVELPIYTFGDGAVSINEPTRMLYSLKHNKNLINGYTGFYPQDFQRLVINLKSNFPSKDSVLALKNRGAQYIIVHKNLYEADQLAKIVKWGKQLLIWENENTLVYEI